MISSDIRNRVRAGEKLLDELGPLGWRTKIDTMNLHITSDSRCILGQLYGYYMRGIEELLGRSDLLAGVEFGFITRTRGWSSSRGEDDDLCEAWRDVLKQEK